MEFKVYTASGEELYHGASRYEIGSGNGVLTVSGDDGKTTVYGPAAWLRVEAHSDAPTMA
jgi:hypothetical protein